jgi:hypothetical protein
MIDLDPTSYSEAMRSPNRAQWKAAIREEWNSLLENSTFEAFKSDSTTPTPLGPPTDDVVMNLDDEQPAIEPPFGSKPLKCRWIFKTK